MVPALAPQASLVALGAHDSKPRCTSCCVNPMADVSLRPLSLRPGGAAGANPFASFGKGAGLGLKNRVSREL